MRSLLEITFSFLLTLFLVGAVLLLPQIPNLDTGSIRTAAILEPGSLLLFGAGVMGAAIVARRRKGREGR